MCPLQDMALLWGLDKRREKAINGSQNRSPKGLETGISSLCFGFGMWITGRRSAEVVGFWGLLCACIDLSGRDLGSAIYPTPGTDQMK